MSIGCSKRSLVTKSVTFLNDLHLITKTAMNMEAIKTSNTDPLKIPDQDLVKRILLGEKELFEILLRRCNQTLYRTIRSYIQYEDDIEDVMQDTYLNAYQKLNQFNGNSSFSTWLIRIGVNEALQRIRKNKRNQIISINDQNIMLDKINQLPDSHQMNPESKPPIKYIFQILVKAHCFAGKKKSCQNLQKNILSRKRPYG